MPNPLRAYNRENITAPEGWKIVDYRAPKMGEYYISTPGMRDAPDRCESWNYEEKEDTNSPGFYALLHGPRYIIKKKEDILK